VSSRTARATRRNPVSKNQNKKKNKKTNKQKKTQKTKTKQNKQTNKQTKKTALSSHFKVFLKCEELTDSLCMLTSSSANNNYCW
jgi:hypothetical protein